MNNSDVPVAHWFEPLVSLSPA